ncbi:hypothetical protein [Pseudocnuella soli]|uniref:hypothetical protein n=1 Tax=Pseudocnuella soli TaxID=2502779 RepID=UPI0010446DDE|nr:hypothetical protein [Pseudocnuella soli]
MNRNSKKTWRTVASVVALGAAVVGIAYYFKDNEKVQQALGSAKTKAQQGYGSVKDTIGQLADAAQKKLAHTS